MPDIFDEIQPDNIPVATKGDIFDQINFIPQDVAEARISNRSSAMADLIRNPVNPLDVANYYKHPLGNILRLMSGASELYQGVPASVALDLQQGKPQNILPNLSKLITGQRPVQYGDVFAGAGVPEGVAKTAGLYTDLALAPGGAEGMEGLGKVAVNLAKKGINVTKSAIDTIKNLPDNLWRGGLNKAEALRVESQYGASNGTLLEQIKNKISNFATEANNMYKNAVNSFKGNSINSQGFYRMLKKELVDKGWMDLQGNPTTRFKSGLDPVLDRLTVMYQNSGEVLSKSDFSTYRDALNAMLKEKPSDISVMRVKNALYNSAENSGMTGIKVARDLEKQAYQISNKFINNNGDFKLINEAKLNKVGLGKLSQQDTNHIEELQRYTKMPILDDAGKINKLNAAKIRLKDIKKYGAGATGAIVAGELGRKTMTGSW